jgi:hypothetical protein
MRTHRFGRKLKLPATIVIKHHLRKLMFEDAVKNAEAGARAEEFADNCAKEHGSIEHETLLTTDELRYAKKVLSV